MMQILSIELKHIKSHRHAHLTFSPGINVLSGANGVGKSTIFEAIGYALFGVDAQSFVGNAERFISIGEKRGEVTVEFVTEGNHFRVSRTVGAPSKWLLAQVIGSDFEVEEHKDIKETEERLKELLGLSSGRSLAEQFELVIGPFQHEFLGPFVIRQASKRRDKFDEILGIDSWRKTFKETKSLANTISSKIEVLQSAIEPLQTQVMELPQRQEDIKSTKAILRQEKADLQTLQKDLKTVTAELVKADKLEQRLTALKAEIGTLDERVHNGNEKIAGHAALIREAEAAKQVMADNLSGKKAYEEAEKRMAQVQEKRKQQHLLEQELAAIERTLAALSAKVDAERDNLNKEQQEIEETEKTLHERRDSLMADRASLQLAARLPEVQGALNALRAQLGQLAGRRAGLEEGRDKLAEGVCPFLQEACQNLADNSSGDVFSDKFSELDQERKQGETELQALEQEERNATVARDRCNKTAVQLKALAEQSEALTARRNELNRRQAALVDTQKDSSALEKQQQVKQDALKVYQSLAAEIETTDADLKRHQKARDLYLAHQQQASKLDGLQAELVRYETLLKQLLEDCAGKKKEWEETSRDYALIGHQTLREEKERLFQVVGALEMKIQSLDRDLLRLAGEVDKLKKIEAEITVKKGQIKAYRDKEELVKFLRNRVFRHVSGSLSDRFREEISLRANRIYRIIAEVDEELCWGENYQIVLRDMVAGQLRERADDQLSGGQTMSAVVALRLAMLQTIGARIAFFDEPTSNLDVTRRENLALAFRAIDVGKEEVTEHWYDQLFLISHDVAFTEVTDQILNLDEIVSCERG